jgi:hypothetical protein
VKDHVKQQWLEKLSEKHQGRMNNSILRINITCVAGPRDKLVNNDKLRVRFC